MIRTSDVEELLAKRDGRIREGHRTRGRILAAIGAGCGHQTYRQLAAQVDRTLSTTYYEVQNLVTDGRLVRCSCGHGWVVADG